MSEYQYYEFLAVDRLLSQREMRELRSISSRAEITPSHFSNEYNWGDLSGDAGEILERYFDVHLYLANWGTRRLAMRLPREGLPLEEVSPYLVSDCASVRHTEKHVHEQEFRGRLDDLRGRHSRKPSFIARLDKAGLFPGSS